MQPFLPRMSSGQEECPGNAEVLQTFAALNDAFSFCTDEADETVALLSIIGEQVTTTMDATQRDDGALRAMMALLAATWLRPNRCQRTPLCSLKILSLWGSQPPLASVR